MRFAAMLIIAVCFAAPLSLSPARAVTLNAAGFEGASSFPIQQVAGPRCGHGAHYVRGHKARNGSWIKGRCVRDHHRR